MSETVNDYIPGRSLFSEITTLREEMETLRKAMGLLVDLQREMHTKLGATLSVNPITPDDAKEQIQ
jgi:hypothetical protein